VPEKATGPRFAIELVKAWKERGRSDAEKKKKGKGKGKVLGVKELRQLCGALNNYLYRLSAEHSRWAQENNRDPRALIQITAERAKLEEELGIPQGDEGFEKFPLHTEKPPESPSATNSAGDPVSPKEPHPGADDPEKAVQADDDVVPSSGRHPGAEVLDDFMRRREAERRDMNRLIDQSGNALVTVETPAPITAETQKPVLLDAVAQSMTDEQYEAIVAARGLKGFGGAAGQNDRALLRKRAAIFHLKGDWSDEDAETICAFRQPFLRSVNKVEDVIERLPDERQQQLATRLNRKNRKRTEETKQD
jgi:hypothetical protein